MTFLKFTFRSVVTVLILLGINWEIISYAQEESPSNSLERFDESDEFYFQLQLTQSKDGVLLDRSKTFDVNWLGAPGAACRKEKSLSTSGALSSEVFGSDGEVSAVLSKQGYCSQPNDAYVFRDGFEDKISAFSFLKSLKSFPTFRGDYRASPSQVRTTAFELLWRQDGARRIGNAFCGFESEVFDNYVSDRSQYSFAMLAIFSKAVSWPDDCARSEDADSNGISKLRMAFVRGEYFEIAPNTIVGVDPIAGTVFRHDLSNGKFCFFGQGYSFAVLDRHNFVELMKGAEKRMSRKDIRKLSQENRKAANRFVATFVLKELQTLCIGKNAK